MLRVRKTGGLSAETLDALEGLQRDVDGAGDYAAQVERTKSSWGTARQRKGMAFDEVKEWLDASCWGNRRCHYCEDSRADEIEHFRPKDLYPDVVFAWRNYLYACGPCNGPKNNHFAVFAAGGPESTDVTRARRDEVAPPPTGDPVLIDPRNEEPLEFLVLDVRETFCFSPRPRLAPRKKERARYSIDLLRLNDRPDLVLGRRTTFDLLTYALEGGVARKRRGATLDGLHQAVLNTPHRFVWEEIKRQRTRLPTLDRCFEDLPEALAW